MEAPFRQATPYSITMQSTQLREMDTAEPRGRTGYILVMAHQTFTSRPRGAMVCSVRSSVSGSQA